MTSTRTGAARQVALDAAKLVLAGMGVSAQDLLTAPISRPEAPTFAEYVPIVAAAVSAGTRRAYGSYWNRILDHWADRRLDEPCACRKPHPCWSDAAHDDVDAVHSRLAAPRQDDRPCCCDWPTSASQTPSPYFVYSR